MQTGGFAGGDVVLIPLGEALRCGLRPILSEGDQDDIPAG